MNFQIDGNILAFSCGKPYSKEAAALLVPISPMFSNPPIHTHSQRPFFQRLKGLALPEYLPSQLRQSPQIRAKKAAAATEYRYIEKTVAWYICSTPTPRGEACRISTDAPIFTCASRFDDRKPVPRAEQDPD
ncbi:hypothetical protein RRG08_021780 [Elysia crispata]|uniref:Uncharacterized protein n=1 Tax=Elysia crispata TaxID=231223 RepID=A0AAE0ZXU9_9GAST|nr:hypothetical protein RRG08_021780 [Elysia crispata]